MASLVGACESDNMRRRDSVSSRFSRDGDHIIVTSPDQVIRTSDTVERPVNFDTAALHFSERDGLLMDKISALRKRLLALEQAQQQEQAEQAVDAPTSTESDPYWTALAEGMIDLLGAQVFLVSRRLDRTAESSTARGQPLGCEGSELEAVVMHATADITHGRQPFQGQQVPYKSYDCPCALMRHDRPVLVPSDLDKTFPDNPNMNLFDPLPSSYLGVPLIMSGINVGHIACMWTTEGRAKNTLSWAQREVILSLFCERIARHVLAIGSFGVTKLADIADGALVEADNNGMVLSDLGSFASKLSHELRTPLQGVIGLLDVLFASLPEPTEQSASLACIIRTIQSSGSNLLDLVNNFKEVCEAPATPAQRAAIARSAATRRDTPSETTSAAGSTDQPQTGTTRAKRTFHESFYDQATPPAQMLFKKPRHSPIGSDADSGERPFETDEFRVEEDLQRLVREAVYKHKLMSQWRTGLGTHEHAGRIAHCSSSACDASPARRPSEITREGAEDPIVTWEVDDDLPRAFLLDRPRMLNILGKLLSNALKFTKQGSVKLSARRGKEGMVLFCVRDTGCGVSASETHRLFKPFSQVDSRAQLRDHDGAGLALVLARKWCRAMGGDCWCERTEPDRGSDFRVEVPLVEYCPLPDNHPIVRGEVFENLSDRRRMSLPVISALAHSAVQTLRTPPAATDPATEPQASDDKSHSLSLPTPPHTSKARSTTGTTAAASTATATSAPPTRRANFDTALAKRFPLKIMVVEDNPVNRRMAIMMLSKLGFAASELIVCEHGLEAVQQMHRVKDSGGKVDLILMDVCMPVLNGLEASRQINAMYDTDADANGSAPHILAVTADATRDNLLKSAETGMAGYILKPYTIKQIEAAIVSLFS